jgi:chaperonin GroES
MAPLSTSSRFNVLLPSEQEGWALTVRQLLEPQGVNTLVVRTGREALRVLENESIHCAVVAQDMPSLNGLQVIKRMNELATRPPAILLANHLTNHLLHEALGMHVFSVLSKPVDLNLLLDALARVMRRFYESRWPGVEVPNLKNNAAGSGGPDSRITAPGQWRWRRFHRLWQLTGNNRRSIKMAQKLRPLGDKILVKRVEAETKTKSGIVLPDSAKEKPKRGKVLAVGEGKRLENGTRAAIEVKKGDEVLFTSYAGTEVKIEGDEVLVMSVDDVLAVVE